MTNPLSDNLKNRQNISSEPLARLLESLSSDIEEAGRRYTRLHQRLVGFFSLKGVSDPVNAADETIDRAALKISRGTPVPDVDKYCLGIARNITKERFRRTQRENLVFTKFIEDLNNSSAEDVERINRILKPCFEQLTVEDQNLLLAYCQVIRGRARAEHRRQLAETMMTTVLALRMRVTRLRTNLTECVKNRLNES
jgi:DNA-directed RNA polymerase specialized sigma24 family protein